MVRQPSPVARNGSSNMTFVVEPSFVFAFVETFINILEEYLGNISSSLIKDHFDVVYQVLEPPFTSSSVLLI
jgi:hypothetical protein